MSSLVFIRTKSKPFTKAWCGLILANPIPSTSLFSAYHYGLLKRDLLVPTSGLLYHGGPLPTSLFLQIITFSFYSFRPQIKCYHLRAFPAITLNPPITLVFHHYSFLMAFVTSEITLFPYLLIISLYHHQTPPISRVPWEHVLFTALSLAPRILQGTQ